MADMLPKWLTLDNSAKYFVPTSNKRGTKVFRLACSLYSDVDPSILQEALDETLIEFPIYKSTLKKGLFWYYLEQTQIHPVVELEVLNPCAPIFVRNKKTLLFRVSYYKKRINLEVFHALSDGGGAIEFLKYMIERYLKLKYPKVFKKEKYDLGYNASLEEKNSDDFNKYYDNRGNRKRGKIKSAYKIKGKKLSESRNQVIEGLVDASKLLELAHKYNTTVTVLISALFYQAIEKEMKQIEKNKSVVMTIPINFRQFYESKSARNFFGVFTIDYNFKKQSNNLEDIVDYIGKSFKDRLNKESVSGMINSFASLERNWFIKPIPLFLKNLGLKLAAWFLDSKNSVIVSNIGKLEFPEVFLKYIDYFDVFISTNKLQICLCSFNDKMMLTFTSPHVNSSIQRNFFRALSEAGIESSVNSNITYKGEV